MGDKVFVTKQALIQAIVLGWFNDAMILVIVRQLLKALTNHQYRPHRELLDHRSLEVAILAAQS